MLTITGDTVSEVNQSLVQQALEKLRTEKFIWRAGVVLTISKIRNRRLG